MEAQEIFGEIYELRKGGKADYEEAATWYRRPADQGDSCSAVRLGTTLFLGKGIQRNTGEAVKSGTRAAEHGNPDAQFNLAEIHILSFFGISQPVVQVRGLVVITTGWALLKQSYDEDPKGVKKNIQPTDPFHNAFYPLTLPLAVGPGSISVAITVDANSPHH